MPDKSRPPNWEKWRQVYELQPHEAVALSLGIAPEKIRQKRPFEVCGRMFDLGGYDEGPEFNDRLFIVQSNRRVIGIPFTLSRFVAWARSHGWQLPPELARVVEREPAADTERRQAPANGKRRAAYAGPQSFGTKRAKRRGNQTPRGPKPGETGFNAADSALFPEIEQMRKSGEARSVIAAAFILVKKGKVVGSGGSDGNRAIRLARRYGRWKSTPPA
jgi:hypothetical protein